MWRRGPIPTSSKASGPAAATRAALIEVEGIEQVKERVRDVRIGSAISAALRDARSGARVLWRSPGYAAVVVFTIALGIGLNAAIFSVVHAVLWRSLPYPNPAASSSSRPTRGPCRARTRKAARCSTCAHRAG
jgi:hypothetical protein